MSFLVNSETRRRKIILKEEKIMQGEGAGTGVNPVKPLWPKLDQN